MSSRTLRRSAAATAAALTLGVSAAVLAPAPQAQASANKVINASNSDGSLNVYEYKNCTGRTRHLWPDQSVVTGHLWRGVYVPKHGAIRFFNKTWGNSYTVYNNGDWRKCTTIGKSYSPFGFRMTYYRNN